MKLNPSHAHPAVLALLLILLPTLALADYSLVWSDEFDGTELNTDDWNYDLGDGCPDLCGWGNNELEYYRSENVTVADGCLTLTARQEFFGGRAFTSGKIHTRDKRHFLYGRMEISAQIPSGQGMWPAFWMLPNDDVYGSWAASGEIDIMESVNEADAIHGTLHFGDQWPNNANTGGENHPGDINFGDGFHVYAVEWEPTVIRWYVDDVLYSIKTNDQWHTNAAPGNPLAPFDQPFFLILNAAVGGNWPGCTNPGCITADLPQEFKVDYVRVYQDTPNTAPTVEITAPTEGGNPPVGTVTIEAEASDGDGTVDRVEFYATGGLIGTDDSAPYSVIWGDVTDGCYEIVAKAYDDAGSVGLDSVHFTVGLGCGQLPFDGSMHSLPTRIEAEHFDQGGEGEAYHDMDAGNNGGAFRPDEAVDIENCTDDGGGYNVGWLEVGEWLEYTIAVPQPGAYELRARVACRNDPGAFHLEIDGVQATGALSVPVTGGWQAWTDVTATLNLEDGQHVLRFVCDADGFNHNYMEFTGPFPTSAAADLPPGGCVLHRCHPNPFNPSTTIAFDLPTARLTELAVYDVRGELVDRIIAGQIMPQGRSEVRWMGKDLQGQPAPAGVYFYRLEIGSFQQTERMVLIK